MKGFGTTTLAAAAAAADEQLAADTDEGVEDEELEKKAAAAAVEASGVVGVDGWGGKSVRVGVHRGDDPLQSSRVWKDKEIKMQLRPHTHTFIASTKLTIALRPRKYMKSI